ncbi:hypothetical protein WIS52_10555 [Pseudonocardia nematodicida]|uniref:Protein phosphatase 2C-like protein n=1 Tax=Pseudonocardia nematodicida TaxID=1206997 RepID=A0ABV1K9M9_9PSEU
MRAATAQLAGGERNADRVLVAEDAVVVLDGATAFEPVDLDPGEYAEAIGREIVRRLPGATITDAVAGAIEDTADAYDLRAGQSPSSTVTVLRVREEEADLYVLGDSPIHYGTGGWVNLLRDGRLDHLAPAERAAYVDALRAGRGYTALHRRILVQLQQEQQRHRNRPGGYWIAEANPDAAHHGVTRAVPREEISWAVLGTDGATDLLTDRADTAWPHIAAYDDAQLQDLLVRLHRWERDADPNGQRLPRAKRHDDKTLAAITVTYP